MNVKIETGDNLLVSSKGILPEAIQWFENCKWNHSAFFLWLNGILYVIEADKHGIALTKFEDYAKSDKGLLILKPKTPFTDKEISYTLNFVLEYTGHTPYEFVNLLVYQPIRYITKFLFGKEIWIGRSKSKSGKKFICGEWVAFVYNKMRGYFDKWNQIAPADIFDSVDIFDHYEYIKSSNKIKKC